MKDGTIEFEALENAKIVKKIYSKLVRDLQEELPKIPNKFTTQTTKNFYCKTSCNVSNVFELSNVSKEVIKKTSLALILVKPLEWTKFQQNF